MSKKKKSGAGKGDERRQNENLEVFIKNHDNIDWTKNEEYLAWLHKSWPPYDAESE